MKTPSRLMAFGAVLAVTFGSAALAGASLGPLRNPDAGHGHADAMAGTHGAAAMGGAGLGVAEGGYVLSPDASAIPRGRRTTFSFRVLGPDGRAVTHFDVAHERRMHLIVVRRDLTGYQHVHPTLDAGGRWSVSLRLPAAGVYRAFADFSTDGAPMTLATDLFVGGSFRPVPLAAPSAVDTSGGYTARLSTTDVAVGRPATLDYALSRGGRPLAGVEPYLGADGHLVALREGDLAFQHVHPEESDTRGTIRFAARAPLCRPLPAVPPVQARRARDDRRAHPAGDPMSPATTPSSERLDLPITGMTCASCAARVEKRLNRLDGVEASVNYATETAAVDFDPAAVTPESLVEAIEQLGYGAQSARCPGRRRWRRRARSRSPACAIDLSPRPSCRCRCCCCR